MKTAKERIIDKCLEVLRREDVKMEIKNITRPIISMIFEKIYPYIVISFIFVIISFLLILGIFVMVRQTKKNVSSNWLAR